MVLNEWKHWVNSQFEDIIKLQVGGTRSNFAEQSGLSNLISDTNNTEGGTPLPGIFTIRSSHGENGREGTLMAGQGWWRISTTQICHGTLIIRIQKSIESSCSVWRQGGILPKKGYADPYREVNNQKLPPVNIEPSPLPPKRNKINKVRNNKSIKLFSNFELSRSGFHYQYLKSRAKFLVILSPNLLFPQILKWEPCKS